GADMTIAMASEGGQLQLNVFEPLIAYKLFYFYPVDYDSIDFAHHRVAHDVQPISHHPASGDSGTTTNRPDHHLRNHGHIPIS
ncbi:MAG: hypothetical protein PHU24_02415, partial [Sphaerochaetaceae bacterium]|nr:hypothetical protein [Sphaerochaetaceae bacterium]